MPHVPQIAAPLPLYNHFQKAVYTHFSPFPYLQFSPHPLPAPFTPLNSLLLKPQRPSTPLTHAEPPPAFLPSTPPPSLPPWNCLFLWPLRHRILLVSSLAPSLWLSTLSMFCGGNPHPTEQYTRTRRFLANTCLLLSVVSFLSE